MNLTKKTKKGSVALISILVISAILIIAVVSASESSVTNSYQYLNKKTGEELYFVAESCLEDAIIMLEEDTSFAGGTLNLNESECISTIAGAGNKTINIEVNSGDYSQSFQAEVSITAQGHANNVKLLNWQKI
jgi:hypothetical protein